MGLDSAASALWYKDAVIYELHVRAFADSDGDGIGDFRGLIGKLDYLQELGVTAIWLLPFFPSPLRDDGYDISDYTAVHPAYGTMDDFTAFLEEAHRRGLHVIIELVLNHTSDQHPWFQRARAAPPGSTERAFYVWSDTPERFRGARVIFQDYEQSNWSWDPVANAYFWHRFYSHQPDLNYEHPPVREAILETVDFWLDLGVDGLRLDAVPYLAEAEGTSSENLPATHRFLRELRAHVDRHYADRMLLAEANQWPEDAAAYFGSGDECHMAFHFPLMPRLFMALRTEDRLPLEDILAQTPPIPDRCQWALFLRNHDELTLEMVTDEERLHMYRAFAPAEEARVNLGIRRRLAPLLGNSRRRIELMNALLCSLPGTPVIYYGDEIGMGDNIYLGDRDGVRTPMQWSADRNAGFSAASPQRLYLPLIVDYEYHHESVHVEAQEGNPHSLLAFMKRLLEVRKRSRAFGRGSLRMLHPANHRVLAFVREHGDERILVVANLSRFSQAVELDLGAWSGLVPVEVFGRIPFWPIGERPYPITLGPHAFYWFLLAPDAVTVSGVAGDRETIPTIAVGDEWAEIVTGAARAELERVLPSALVDRAWLRGAAATVLTARLLDAVPLPGATRPTWIVLVRLTYSDRDPDIHLLALAAVPKEEAERDGERAIAPIARLQSRSAGEAVLVDAIDEGAVHEAVSRLVDERGEALVGAFGTIVARRTGRGDAIGALSGDAAVTPTADPHGHNPVFQRERVVVKFLRRVNEGISPEWEIGQALTERGFDHAPTVLGALEYRRPRDAPMTIAVLQARVPNDGHAWEYTARFLDEYIGRALAQGIVVSRQPTPTARELLAASSDGPEEQLDRLLTPWLDFGRLLGRRTAELHLALASIPGRPEFAPEPHTTYGQRSRYQSMRGLAARALRALRQATSGMDEPERRVAEAVLGREHELYDRFRAILDLELTGYRIRCHGDFHLGQVLLTGSDVVFVDFEGEPDRLLEERRLKTSPLRDVAGMLHSFRFVAMDVAARQREEPDRSAEHRSTVDALLETWCRFASVAYLDGYRRAEGIGQLLPATEEAQATLIDILLLERAVYHVLNVLLHQSDRVALPLERLRSLLDDDPR